MTYSTNNDDKPEDLLDGINLELPEWYEEVIDENFDKPDIKDLIKNQKEIPQDIAEVIDENFDELLGDE